MDYLDHDHHEGGLLSFFSHAAIRAQECGVVSIHVSLSHTGTRPAV